MMKRRSNSSGAKQLERQRKLYTNILDDNLRATLELQICYRANCRLLKMLDKRPASLSEDLLGEVNFDPEYIEFLNVCSSTPMFREYVERNGRKFGCDKLYPLDASTIERAVKLGYEPTPGVVEQACANGDLDLVALAYVNEWPMRQDIRDICNDISGLLLKIADGIRDRAQECTPADERVSPSESGRIDFEASWRTGSGYEIECGTPCSP